MKQQAYAVITENDESQWDDKTGEQYHFPKRYLKYLQTGTQVIYYKGKMVDKSYQNKRLTEKPHYFGIAKIGKTLPEDDSQKNWFADIIEYRRFSKPVLNKSGNEYLEIIPTSMANNYWRNGVRPIDEETYKKILNLSDLSISNPDYNLNDNEQGSDKSFTSSEGAQKQIFTTVYERDSRLREQAIRIHGLTCQVCGLNFEKKYGEWGKGFIHVHHNKPVSVAGERIVNPREDMSVLCANCHSMIHRKKNTILSIEDLKSMLK